MSESKRWRKVKSQHIKPKDTQKPQSAWINLYDFSLKKQLILMHASARIKAFITDMFMINMPLLYLTTYVFLDGKEDFTHNQMAILSCGLAYGIITSLFFALTHQTPGFRYMQLRLVRFPTQKPHTPHHTAPATQELDSIKIGFFRAFARYVLWVFGTSFLFGILIGFLRRDGRCLHDIVCKTQVISI
ncbi:RDD family protein [Helicobacter jaachi]|uniref:RDD family protein n=1 Tax=Helicobacter jaachi TaxID=1677920 RepID=A0A4U8TCX9_9HELI|nr:RDD family protein [Helicobacter jaachi]TLD97825.1 RDD family protein [Helicobacter jaachi]